MKAVAAALQQMSQQQITELERQGSISLTVDGQEAVVPAEDVEIISEDIPGWLVANEGSLTVALDVTVTPELRMEGIARELVNRIQNIRKGRDYNITDRIDVTVAPNNETDEAVNHFKAYIADQVLASSLEVAALPDGSDPEVLDLDGVNVEVVIDRHG